ncbi:MAG: TatD family hydrolase [Mogibacterium sp.]|nr:TatD family hydrolase [Mogibacterium sp.]
MLFDAHTHLNFQDYTDEERAGLAAEIEASEVGYIVDVADCVASAKQALADAAAYPWCYAAVGIHPDHAPYYMGICGDDAEAAAKADRELEADIDEIRKLAADPKAVCIGEIGLDFHYGKDDHAEQEELFRRQIRLANELKLPIMIHSRDAHKLTMDILKEEGAFSDERKSWFPGRPCGDGTAPDARVQLHCFSGSYELAEEYVKLGATISLGGPITFKNGKKAAEVAQKIPLEFLLSETDAPYLAPEPFRGRPNESPYIEHVVRRMAMLKGISYGEAADKLTANAMRFFGIEEK